MQCGLKTILATLQVKNLFRLCIYSHKNHTQVTSGVFYMKQELLSIYEDLSLLPLRLSLMIKEWQSKELGQIFSDPGFNVTVIDSDHKRPSCLANESTTFNLTIMKTFLNYLMSCLFTRVQIVRKVEYNMKHFYLPVAIGKKWLSFCPSDLF